jgi:uncharacterized Zn finger protein
LRKSGKAVSPIEIVGRRIATTFWGGAWCDNLERYSDFANRLPRGRTYVRNGSVIDLQIAAGQVTALVSGSDVYSVMVTVAKVPASRWKTICRHCAGGIDSLVELLQGRLSTAVMEHLCKQGTGLFPTPHEIEFTCSCPDWASMCKHVAAVLYGVGARLDHQPALLFRLRQVDEQDLLARAGTDVPLSKMRPASSKILADEDVAGVFGVELARAAPIQARRRSRAPKTTQAAKSSDQIGRKSGPAGAKSSVSPTPAEPPKRSKPSATAAGRRGVTPTAKMSAAARNAVSERMKRYWQERRRQIGSSGKS